jgi:ABC-type nitrate/sulfonate/bicarbonate transport system substrate-binding protein
LLASIGMSLAIAVAMVGATSRAGWSQSPGPADATPIVIGLGSPGTAQIPLYIALREGFFKKAGLDVESQALSGGTPSAMASFASGAVNILSLSAPELIQYVAKKVINGKAFGEIVDQSYDIVSSRAITRIEDIKGKTIGISSPNSGDQIYFLALMQHYGISPNDVTFITSGNPLTRIAALAAGSIDVTAATNVQRDQATKAGTILLKSGDSPVQFPTNVFIANRDLLDNHKPLLKKFLSVLSETMVWMRANPAAAAADCAATLGATVDVCTTLNALNFDQSVQSKFTWSSTLAVSVEGMKSALAVMAAIDPDAKNLTVDDVADTSIAGTTP